MDGDEDEDEDDEDALRLQPLQRATWNGYVMGLRTMGPFWNLWIWGKSDWASYSFTGGVGNTDIPVGCTAVIISHKGPG